MERIIDLHCHLTLKAFGDSFKKYYIVLSYVLLYISFKPD